MPQDATCPTCSHVFPILEARYPVTVICPRCDGELTAEFKKPTTPPEPGQPPYEVLVKRGPADDAATHLPTKSKRRNDHDNDEEERPRGNGSAMVVLLSGGMGLMFVLGGLALTGWYLFTQVNTEEETVSRPISAPQPANNSWPKPQPLPQPQPQPWPQPNPWPKPNPTVTFPDPIEQPKPKETTFDLKPVSGKLTPISPPKDVEEGLTETILLPGRADAVSVGGGGRYIILHYPEGRLQVFDVNLGNISNEIATEDKGQSHVAGGANVVVTAHGEKIRVYSLPDLKLESAFNVNLFAGVNSMAMGAATNGPLLISNPPFGDVQLIDLKTGRPIEGASSKPGVTGSHIRATHDGLMFLCGNGYSQNDKFSMLAESARRWQLKSPEIAAAYPSADGKRLYGQDQIMTNTGSVIVGKPKDLAHAWYVPAITTSGDYFLRLNETKIGAPPRNVISVSLHKDKDVNTPLVTAWEGLPETERLVNPFFVSSEPLDKHLFLIPEAKLLVILNADKNRLVVRKLAF